MSMSSHLAELKKKHSKLAEKVEDIQRQPSADQIEIAGLKKQKLRLKEEITRLTH